jgi:hypothetical protein
MNTWRDAAKAMAGVVAGSLAAGFGFGVLGVALNIALLVRAAPAVRSFLATADAPAWSRVLVVVLVGALILLPVAYAILGWRNAFRRRLGRALRPYEDRMMEMLTRAATEYAESRSHDPAHAVSVVAHIRRAKDLPGPVRFVLARLAEWTGLAEAVEAAMRSQSGQPDTWGAVMAPVLAAVRAKLDAMAFNPGRTWIVLLIALNVAVYTLLIWIT